jgi:ATP-binding cassette, subfamily B, bacterial
VFTRLRAWNEERKHKKAGRAGSWDQWKTWPRIIPYLKPYRKLVVLSFFLTVVGAVVGLAEPWPLALVIDNVIDTNEPPQFLQALFGESPDQYRLLAFIVGAGFLIVIVSHGVRVLNDYVNAKIEQNIVMDLRSDMFAHCERLSLTFHDERHTGQLMSQINMQASAIGSIVMAFPPLLESFLMLIGMFVIALLIDWQVTLVSMIAVPFIYYAIGIYGTRIVPRIQRVQSLEFRSLSIVFEAMSMLRVIVSFGRERHEHYRFVTQGRIAVDARVRLTVWQTLFSLMVTTATALGTALVLGFGALHVIQGKISLGELTVLISYIAAVYQPLESISLTIGHLHQYFVYFNASVALLIEDPEVMEVPNPVVMERARGDVEFHDVSFAYKGRNDTLQDVSFKAEAGQRIAVVGPTGAGKTTLFSLLVRFYDPKSGTITIDGVDMKELSLDSLRSQLSLVLQEPLLFSGSIEDNIRYGRLEASKSDIVEAAEAANAHDFITKLPQGYDTELGERGAQLSGGERQRICVHSGRPDPYPGRAHLIDRLPHRAGDPRRARPAHGEQNVVHDRPPPVHDPQGRQDPRHQPGPPRRAGDARGARDQGRPLLPPLRGAERRHREARSRPPEPQRGGPAITVGRPRRGRARRSGGRGPRDTGRGEPHARHPAADQGGAGQRRGGKRPRAERNRRPPACGR